MNSDSAPLWVLRPSTIAHLSTQLQSEKLLPTEAGQLRDWRGVAELAGLCEEGGGGHSFLKIKNSTEDHFQEIFNQWKKVPAAKVKDLWDVLEQVDRFDVIDDNADKVAEDVRLAETTAQTKGLELRLLPPVQQAPGLLDQEGEALTYDDLHCLNTGQSLPKYDAFILYGEQEQNFALDVLVTNLESQGLRILVKDRDLLGGTFEHSAVMNLISRRCHKLITVFSNSFFCSEYNTFLANYAQHETLEQPGTIKNKIIPLVIEDCQIPANLSLYNKLRYDPSNRLHQYFWSRLAKSIKPSVNFDATLPMVEADSNFASTAPSAVITSTKTSVTKSAGAFPTPSEAQVASDQSLNSGKTGSKVKKLLARSPKPVPPPKSSPHPPIKTNFSSMEDPGLEGSSSEPSSLESEVTGESGALLLPSVPTDDDNLFSKIKKKLAPNKKTKYKTKQLARDSSAC